MTTALWIVAVMLVLAGVAGTMLPALPGIPLIFGGVLLAAWIDDFQRISVWSLVILGVLAAIGMAIDYVAVGPVAGIFTGLWGLVFMPLVGAAIGEYIAQRDAIRAGKVGLATWFGLLIGTAVKIAIAFTMIGVFLVALFF